MSLTIVLTLKDRSSFTKRWMNYMNDVKCPYKILIADGGYDSEIQEYLSNKSNFPNLIYEYIRYPKDSSLEIFYEKLNDVIMRVNTKYILLADNDDFFLLKNIKDILSFLDSDDRYIGARGAHVELTIYGRDRKLKNITQGYNYLALQHFVKSIEDDTSELRFENFINNLDKYNYYQNWYCIFNTQKFQSVWKELNMLPVKDINIQEIITHFLILRLGKLKIFDFPFYIRQGYTSQLSEANQNKVLEGILNTNSFSNFLNLLKNIYKDYNIKAYNDSYNLMISWIEKLIVGNYNKRLSKDSLSLNIKVYLSNSSIIPFFIIKLLLYLRFILKKSYKKPIRLVEIENHILVKK